MVSYSKLKIIDRLRREKLLVVNTGFLKQLTGLTNPQSLASFIKSLVKHGILEKAERGKYLVVDNLGNDFAIANLLYKPSYISLETALSYYGILSQFPMEIGSVSARRKKSKTIAGKPYVYYQINPKLYWGFTKKNNALIALPEKALLDLIYFTSKGIKSTPTDELDLPMLDKKLFLGFSKKYPAGKSFNNLVKITYGLI